MNRSFPALLLGALAGIASLRAQVPTTPAPTEPTPLNVVQTFDGTGSTTTAPFQVQNKWEVKWNCRTPLKITVYSADHTVVAGTMGLYRGSFFLAAGGSYYLQIDGMTPPSGPVAPSTGLQDAIAQANGGEVAPHEDNGTTTTPNPTPNPYPYQPGAAMGMVDRFKWHVEVVALNPSDPLATPPPVAQVPVPPPAAPPVAASKLTDDQARAVVLISGDHAEGTGFLIKTPDGPAVVTNIHVIANNPNLKITTNTGALITMLSAKGASDRDLVLLAIQDGAYSYLDMSTDVSHTVLPGDEVITPGNSQGGEVMLNTSGKVLGIGPVRVEIDNPIYHGNSGGPIFHPKSNKVLGVVTEAMKIDMSNDLDRASFASRNSAISGSMRYFGLRLDTVSGWVPIDWNRFQIETTFLDEFHERSRYLDSYLNGKDNSGGGGDADASKLYRKDEKIMKANDRYVEQAAGSDIAQRIQAARGLLFDLQAIVDVNLDQIQNPNNFYSFDAERVRDELAYRKALKSELDSIGNNVDRLGGLPRSNN